MKTKIFDESVKIMSDIIRENSQKISDEKSFPVACVIISKEGEILSKTINEKGQTEKNVKHAESLALEEIIQLDEIPTEMTMLVTVPPCKYCYSKMLKINPKIKWEIFYLNDDVRLKMENKFWDIWKNKGHKITKLYTNRLTSKESKLRLLYCIDQVMSAFASHKNNDKKIVELKRKSHRQKMHKYFKSMRPSRGQIQTSWVYAFYKNNKVK